MIERSGWGRPDPVVTRIAGLVALTVGEETAPHRVPLVLLPGELASSQDEFGLLLPLLARTRRVIALDWEVPAESASAESQSQSRDGAIDGAADQVIAALEAIAPGRRVDLVGVSLGATIAARVAARDRVARLVLIGGWLDVTERQRRFARLHGAAPAALRDQLLGYAAFSSAGLDETASHSIAGSAWSGARMALLASVSLADVVAGVQTPTLVIGCADDAIVPREQSRALFAALDDSRYAELDSGHAALAERPIEVLQLIEEFLEGDPRGTARPQQAAAEGAVEGART
ncbi:alpha/beta fold hydrolase [Naasia lichenicola]|uniref:Alpha/beta fold hydrolase n=1 Tax=Naasia lichenicola TaxID=2565933 RepID=A0A4S4FS39_9MICO|nr:alpha/beta fold hydrolase [Naasia lichenicola]THG33509.1 alpha/beta fold hydrolase [Naasia lichenicola]